MEEIKQGYKQTDIGVIPEDWELEPIGNILVFKNGLNKAKEFFGYGTPIVNYMDVYSKDSLRSSDIKGRVHLSNSEILRYEIKVGDVFFTRTSETPEEVGISSVVLDCEKNTVFSGFVLRGRPIKDKLINEFKSYCFQTKNVRNSIIQGCTYTTRALTNGTQLSKILIAFPNKKEQTAIATALSDIDALIAALDKKIAKKQQIKQGAMQQLLTGKKRLPGFSGEWVEKKLGDTLIIKHGRDQKQIVCINGEFPILGTGGVIGRTNTPIYSKPSVLIGRKGTIDKPYYFDTPFWTVDTLFFSEIRADYNAKFIYYIFNLIDWYMYNEASGVPSLNAKVIESIRVILPITLEEQTAVAQILTDMDNEITELEKKRDKYEQLKAGMMQQLLTGKIRIV